MSRMSCLGTPICFPDALTTRHAHLHFAKFEGPTRPCCPFRLSCPDPPLANGPGLGTTRCSRPGRPLSKPSCQYEFYRKLARSKAPGPANSITSSALACSVSGTVRPSVGAGFYQGTHLPLVLARVQQDDISFARFRTWTTH